MVMRNLRYVRGGRIYEVLHVDQEEQFNGPTGVHYVSTGVYYAPVLAEEVQRQNVRFETIDEFKKMFTPVGQPTSDRDFHLFYKRKSDGALFTFVSANELDVELKYADDSTCLAPLHDFAYRYAPLDLNGGYVKHDNGTVYRVKAGKELLSVCELEAVRNPSDKFCTVPTALTADYRPIDKMDLVTPWSYWTSKSTGKVYCVVRNAPDVVLRHRPTLQLSNWKKEAFFNNFFPTPYAQMVFKPGDTFFVNGKLWIVTFANERTVQCVFGSTSTQTARKTLIRTLPLKEFAKQITGRPWT